MSAAASTAASTAPVPQTLRTEPHLHCTLCASTGRVLHGAVRDLYFGVPGSWRLKRCEKCALVWQDPMVVADDLVLAYGNYYTVAGAGGTPPPRADRLTPGFLRLDRWATALLGLADERQRHAAAYLHDVRPGRLLDVGCGSGEFAARMKRAGWRANGTEFDPVAARHAREAHGIEVDLGDLAEIAYPAQTFDAITVRHVVEHVRDPAAFVAECWRILKPGGRLVLITPNVDSLGHRYFGTRWRGLEQPRHLHLFNAASMRELFDRSHVSPVEIFSSAQGTAYTLNASSLTSESLMQRALDHLSIWWLQWRETRRTRRGDPVGEELVAIAPKPAAGTP